MSESAPAPTYLTIDRVERSRAKKDQVRLRVSGHWLAEEPPVPEALLVVHAHGRRYRFAAGRDKHHAAADGAGTAFAASFTIPDWAVPEQSGQAVLWVGDVVVAVPPPGTLMPSQIAPPIVASTEPPVISPDAQAPPVISEAGRSGPLADLLYKETVSALRSELEQRAIDLARLRGQLAQSRSDLESRSGSHAGLETAHAQLREELERLTGAVDRQRDEFEQRTAVLLQERDEARREADAAAKRLERERADADARLTEARARFDDHLATARLEFDQQLTAVRAEAEAELDRNRAENEAMLGAARAQAESRAAAAEAQAMSLSERVAALSAAQPRLAQEAAALREELAAAHIAREAAFTEADGLRSELDRLGAELAVTRERGTTAGSDLSEAEQLLADARALTERLRGEFSG
jgi:uncharacterized coiled-coil DUF342 family protein